MSPTPVPAADAVDPRALRNAIGHFATGVTVVTALDGGGHPFGTTANAVSSLSLDPPLVLICLKQGSETLAALTASGSFAINVLRDDQQDLAHRFAGKAAADTWAGVDHEPGLVGAPRLAGALATLECTLHDVADGGDHRIVVGRVLAVEHPDDHVSPLVFYRGGFAALPAPPAIGTDLPVRATPTGLAPAPAAVAPASASSPLGAVAPAPVSPTLGGPPSAALLAELPDVALPSGFGDLRLVPVANDDHGATSVIALVGEPRDRAGTLVYLHEGCLLGDALGHTACRRRAALHAALERLRTVGTGVVVYHRDDRRPFSGCCFEDPGAHRHDGRAPAPDPRPLAVLRTAIDGLGLTGARLLVPDEVRPGDLDAATVGLEVAERVALAVPGPPF